ENQSRFAIPRMPRVENYPRVGNMGVLLMTCTTLLACTARSTVPRQRNAPVQNPLLLLRLINTLGSSIAVGCFRHRSPPDCEFAPHDCRIDRHRCPFGC